tara:strand:+ start:1616 stop:2305 length:690 start_codon:yes stop_codon:yes gene_type:complete
MILTAHQPSYLPWLGLISKIMKADLFCYFDCVQYQKKEYDNRNLIKTNSGILKLSVPVESKNHFKKKINEIKIINKGWNKKHIKSIKLAYQKSNYFNKYFPELESILINEYEKLTDLNFKLLEFLLRSYQIKIPIVKASDYHFTGVKSLLVLDMCKKLNAKEYIFGGEGKNYANTDEFNKNNIKTHFQAFNHPIYNQLHGKFIPNLSSIDLLFNEGLNSSKILSKNNKL